MLNQEQKEREEKLEIFIPNGPRLGNKVIEAQHVIDLDTFVFEKVEAQPKNVNNKKKK